MSNDSNDSNSPLSMVKAQNQCRSVHVRRFTTGQKTVENRDWATVAGPSQAVGRRSAF